MGSKRSSIAMTPTEVDAYLAEPRTMNIATLGPTGHPHLVAMWYGFHEGKPAFWTFGKAQKVMNLRRDPRITALVESGTTYAELRGVELVGTARMLESFDDVLAIGLSVAERHNGPDAVSDKARPFIEAQARKRIGVVIDVERVVSWDHTKLGGAY